MNNKIIILIMMIFISFATSQCNILHFFWGKKAALEKLEPEDYPQFYDDTNIESLGEAITIK